MPLNKNAYIRYRMIDSLLRIHPFVKTSTIIEKLYDRHDLSVSERTINKDVTDMCTELHAPIEYNHSEKAYYYPQNVTEIFPSLDLHQDEITALTFYAKTLQQYKDFGIFEDFTNAIDKVTDAVRIKSTQSTVRQKMIIHPENFPKFHGSDLIPEIISGFDTKKKFEFDYLKHTSDTPKRHLVTPLLLKEYDHLWYLIGQIEGKEFVTIFALDRISNFQLSNIDCEIVSSFDPDHYFNHAFGIAVPEGEVEDVVLEFDAWRGRYLISAPIHKSQELVQETEDKITLRIKVIPFHELHAKILGYGNTVRVVSPESLKLKIKQLLQDSLNKY